MRLLVCAVAQELAWFIPASDVEVLVCGVGPVDAAARVAQALAARSYATVVNVGIAGAFDGVAPVGAGVVVANERLELDVETGIPIVLPHGERPVEWVASDPSLVSGLAACGMQAVRGITVGRVTATEATAERLARLGAQVETMEGFAVLRAAELAGIPAIELRGISNRVGERARNGWNFDAGIAGLQQAMQRFAPALGRQR